MSRVEANRNNTVAVVGGGCAGVLATTHLLYRSKRPMDIVLIEPGPRLGAGIAYGTDSPDHLLNAPAREMSGFSNYPNDFVDWAHSRGFVTARNDYLPRPVYREYLADLIHRARNAAPTSSTLEWIREEATAVALRGKGNNQKVVVGLAQGGHVVADHVILALGAPRPTAPWPISKEVADAPQLIVDPWKPNAFDVIDENAEVLLVGTGLTMVDVALTLLLKNDARKVIARSRHGLRPIAHLNLDDEPLPSDGISINPETAPSAREVFRTIRQAIEKGEVAGHDWREVISALRCQAQPLWSILSVGEQTRLLNHAARYWDVHRHRMAPSIGSKIDQFFEAGRLQIAQGSVWKIQRLDGRFQVLLRNHGEIEKLDVDAIINCSGGSRGYAGTSRLITHLCGTGLARPDPFGLGIDVDANGDLVGDLINEEDNAMTRLHTLGWPRRGRFIETTAVPEIRLQSEELARRIGEDLS